MATLRWSAVRAEALFAFAWIVLVTSSLVFTFRVRDRLTLHVARAEARAAYEKDLLYRRWVAMQGGVYVTPSEQTPPNPFLEGLPDRDLRSSRATLRC